MKAEEERKKQRSNEKRTHERMCMVLFVNKLPNIWLTHCRRAEISSKTKASTRWKTDSNIHLYFFILIYTCFHSEIFSIKKRKEGKENEEEQTRMKKNTQIITVEIPVSAKQKKPCTHITATKWTESGKTAPCLFSCIVLFYSQYRWRISIFLVARKTIPFPLNRIGATLQ